MKATQPDLYTLRAEMSLICQPRIIEKIHLERGKKPGFSSTKPRIIEMIH